MLFERLELCDVGVFRGRHTFDLLPRRKQGAVRPIILFGGLNGAGKTTILTSIRVALYGRQTLGAVTSQKVYSHALSELIHRYRAALVPTTSASITLEFTYSKLGIPSQYRVTRSWTERGKQVEEQLRIHRDGERLDDLTAEQAQGLLNQLIPPGVAQFFFFDGEKIADLAADEGDASLGESIKRLLGLNVVERLNGDLMVFLRQQKVGRADEAARGRLAEREDALQGALCEIDEGYAQLRDEFDPELEAVQRQVAGTESELRERGGAWASGRGALKARLDKLVELKAACEERVRELLSGSFPLALAPGVSKVLRDHLVADRESNRSSALATLVQGRLPMVRARLDKTLRAAQLEQTLNVIEDVFGVRAPTGGATDSGKPSITDGDQVAAWLLGIIDHAVPAARGEMLRLVKELRGYQDELESLGERLAQAPDESTLQTLFDQLKTASERLGELRAKRRGLIERLRRALWQAVTITRELRRLEDEVSDSTTHALVVERAESVRTVLTEFAEKLTERKLQVLRQHFLAAFVRLARKEDLIVDAHIEPFDFSVSLIDRDGNKIPKQRLSAGEKQIYAIAMLEALARTSGRNLPVVIDTPLGRLDSKHRTKLVEHYFPTASHQVIILSTDTEVDEPFYRGLSRHISHAYHLEFDQVEGFTRASEGYFWRTPSEVGEHVA